MRMPTPGDFQRAYGDNAGLPWCARGLDDDGRDFDLYVPGENEWPNEAPDAPSVALAGRLLSDLDELRGEAAAYVLSIVDVSRRPLFGEPELVCLSCDAGRKRVIVEVNWESMPDALWYVELHLHPTLGRRPSGMGVTAWGPRDSPWPPEHVRLELPRLRPP